MNVDPLVNVHYFPPGDDVQPQGREQRVAGEEVRCRTGSGDGHSTAGQERGPHQAPTCRVSPRDTYTLDWRLVSPNGLGSTYMYISTCVHNQMYHVT